ncbi:MAG: 50S ribosomal protein L18 [Euryarchaeota archaeon]|nr:50S ribosomal protein L18 [Euryarchaeota archaeon]
MAHGPKYKLAFRRRREGKTDYRRRKALLTPDKPRAVVRRSIKYVSVQLVNTSDKGDMVVAAATSRELKELGWKASGSNTAAGYLTGYMAGKRAAGKKMREAVLDIGLATPVKGGVLFGALKGLIDAGLKVPHDPESLPKEDRLKAGKGDIARMIEQAKDKIDGGA